MAAFVITPEIEADAQELARRTGQTPTEALAGVLRDRLAELSPQPPRGPKKTAEEVTAMIRSYNLHATNDLSEEEILGLDEHGIPEQTPDRSSHIGR